MHRPSPDHLLERILRETPRRYRLGALPPLPSISPTPTQINGTSTVMAVVIEHARQALTQDEHPNPALQRVFVNALAVLVQDAMRAQAGDPAFQAMVLRQESATVREYAGLTERANDDRRRVHNVVNAFAHPGKLTQLADNPWNGTLAQLHKHAANARWAEVANTASRLLEAAAGEPETPVAEGATRLLESPALDRLLRREALEGNAQVRRYLALWGQQGPLAGSDDAVEQGAAARKRGDAVEAQSALALQALAQRLNARQDGGPPYRVVASLRVPAALPGTPDRAKSEWDVVLLRQAGDMVDGNVWDVRLLVEAKATVDAVATDLPRLLRGLQLLASADPGYDYAFASRQGAVTLRGASLSELGSEAADLPGLVLYCCDVPGDAQPRLLSAAGRMQLLSAPESLAYAAQLAATGRADTKMLEPLWQELLTAPRWEPVLQQYPMLEQARELAVHPEDLLAAVENVTQSG